MTRLRHYQADILIILGFLLLPLLLYGSVTLGNKTMLPADNLFQWAPWQQTATEFDAQIPQNHLITDLVIENYVWKKFVADSVQAGEIPLWNPYLFAGMPSFGSLAYPKFVYPPAQVFNFLQQKLGFVPLTWLFGHLIFGGLGMMWLLSSRHKISLKMIGF